MKNFRVIVYFLILLSFTTLIAQNATAQNATCGADVERALNVVGQSCAVIGRNQACYGYVSLQATPRTGVENFNFKQDGDLVNVADIDSLRLSRFDPVNKTWGIALMKLQASLPDSLPGQNVAFLVFGDVDIQNASAPGAGQPSVQVTANSKINIRSTPSTNGAVIGSFAAGETTTANGRNADGSWLRIQLPETDSLGWVFASLVSISGDTSTLTVVDAEQAETQYTPMQAFYFKTGITETSCAEAPQDGILIQTPKGVGQVNLRANDVDIQLGSTAFFQAQPSGNMTVSVVEGEGHVTAQGQTVDVPAGMQSTIPMDANLRAAGVPSPAQPYDAALVEPLPIRVLPEVITIVLPEAEVTPEATETPNAGGGGTSGGIGPYTVQKTMDLGGVEPSGSVCSLEQPFEVTFSQAGIITWNIQFVPDDATKGTYSYSYSMADVGETATGEGTYTVSDEAADGSRELTFDGTQTNKFTGANVTMQLHFSFGLTPTGSCGS